MNFPRGLIIPHAAEQYSGHIATDGLKILTGHAYDLVVVLGPNHQGSKTGVYAKYQDFHQPSPLVNQFLLQYGTADDHSIGWDVRLLNKYVNGPILPIIVGSYNERLVQQLVNVMTPNSLIITTSDLSHYLPAMKARIHDRRTIQNIFDKKGPLEACGREAIKILLDIIDDEPFIISYSNSGAMSRDWSSVVGYTAIQFGGQDLLLEQGSDLLAAYLKQEELPSVSKKKVAVFITITRAGKLQGCTGQMEAAFSFKDAILRAFHSTLEDPRFDNPRDLNNTEIKLSILTPLQRTQLKDVKIGIDGLVIKQGSKGAIFLPEVPVEYQWDLKKYLKELLDKAGINPRSNYQLFKYQTKAITLLM